MNERDLRAALVRELESDPEVDSARIAVAVENDAVTLRGRVRSFPEKLAALRAAERVPGVRAVADEIVVVPPDAEATDDVDIAKEIVDSLRWNVLVPRTVKVEVHDGHVTLRGRVRHRFQREAAEKAARATAGVKGVTNLIAVRGEDAPRDPREVESGIREAIRRAGAADAGRVWVETTDDSVRLYGKVRSLYEKKLAESAARKAPGVSEVDNELIVDP